MDNLKEENQHTVDKCPFGLTIHNLTKDVRQIRDSLVGDEKGEMGLAAKVNLMWALNLAIIGLLIFQVAPGLAKLIRMGL